MGNNNNDPYMRAGPGGAGAGPSGTGAGPSGTGVGPTGQPFPSAPSTPSIPSTPIFTPPPVTFKPPPAPKPPSTAQLQALLYNSQRQQSLNKAMADYDALSSSTKAQGFQAADNAGTSYANRLMQSGINATSAGVVSAQSKLPVYSQLATINTQKDQTQLDAVNRSQSLAAQIAAQIAQIQLGYTKTLADYNSQQTGYNLDLQKFNSNLASQNSEFSSDSAQKAAEFAATQAQQNYQFGVTNQSKIQSLNPNANRSYIPDQGPIQFNSPLGIAGNTNYNWGM